MHLKFFVLRISRTFRYVRDIAFSNGILPRIPKRTTISTATPATAARFPGRYRWRWRGWTLRWLRWRKEPVNGSLYRITDTTEYTFPCHRQLSELLCELFLNDPLRKR